MQSQKFLQQVADYYISKGADMSSTTMVFPNRRSALFMRKYMHERLTKPSYMPRMISITYFTQLFCPVVLGSDTELAFVLYNAYCEVLRAHGREEQIRDFDTFYFWGLVLLSDFNDVDAYMVDADQLFHNLKTLRKIASNHLTPEQVEVAELLWGKGAVQVDTENFWKHVRQAVDANGEISSFINLWEIMGEVYESFRELLGRRDIALAYSGMQSRQSADTIKSMGKEDFKGEKYVFVGFNALSTARVEIFKRLKDLGIAEFFWDVSSPLLFTTTGDDNRAGAFVLAMSRKFPMPDDFDLQPQTHRPEIEIISAPSNVGQTKVVADVLASWAQEFKDKNPDGKISPADMLDTAVVMADESLLMPMLYSIPQDYSTINVTMGLSYQYTPFATLMSSIISMHMRAHLTRGVFHYFYQDVVEVLSHPHINMIAQHEAEQIKRLISENHIYNVSSEEIISEYPQLGFIFRPISDQRDIENVRSYIVNLAHGLKERLKKHIPAHGRTDYYELSILDGYADTVENLCGLMKKYGISVYERTFLQMLERTLAISKLSFSGEPLKGLQLMGVMDTRVLNFDNLILTSMNERTFPRRNYSPSLIPAVLRSEYMMPTQDEEEASYAYQFFRLVSSAKRVKLIYDSRTAGISSGEMSRYLAQLVYLRPQYGVKTVNLEFTSVSADVPPIEVKKTPEVLRELEQFREGGKRSLSASALKTYLKCPLKFYLTYVKGVRENDVEMQFIDAASYGTVIHSICEELYTPYKDKEVNPTIILKMKHNDIERKALEVLNREYYRNRYAGRLDMVPGEGILTAKIIAAYIKHMLDWEMKYHPFVFVAAEYGSGQKFQWEINKDYTINFKMSVDRIDRIRKADGTTALRFIDYKTGSDELGTDSLDKLFTEDNMGGMFQLLVYSYAYARIFGYDGEIKPMIYKFVTLPKDGIKDLKFAGAKVDDYRQVQGFYERFESLIDDIFETEGRCSFTQTADAKNCKFCQFAPMCGRYVDGAY